MSQPLKAVMVGAGNRGYYAYGLYALQHPGEIRFTAVVEPHDERRRRFAEAHGIPRRSGSSTPGKTCTTRARWLTHWSTAL